MKDNLRTEDLKEIADTMSAEMTEAFLTAQKQIEQLVKQLEHES